MIHMTTINWGYPVPAASVAVLTSVVVGPFWSSLAALTNELLDF